MIAAQKVLNWMKKFHEQTGPPTYEEIVAQLEMAIDENIYLDPLTPLKDNDIVGVQGRATSRIYKKGDGELYFTPYGKEEKVSSYFRGDLELIKR